jgi:hypothetical protein
MVRERRPGNPVLRGCYEIEQDPVAPRSRLIERKPNDSRLIEKNPMAAVFGPRRILA